MSEEKSGPAKGHPDAAIELNKLYRERFPEQDLESKDAVWKILCEKFFQAMIEETETVLDLGAGHGEFLRHITCAQKIAVELNPEGARWLPPGVRLVESPSWNMDSIQSESVNTVFASNFFEHLPTKNRLIETLSEVRRVLLPSGKIIILQPNLAFLHGRFFDFFDHHLPLTHGSMIEALAISGFNIKKCLPRFLPFTTRSRLPKAPWLVSLYLKFPPAWRIMGKQMLIVAEKQD